MTITSLIEEITNLIALTIPIALALALFAFFWQVYQSFGKLDSVDSRAEARNALVWSIIALFVVVSLGGIIAVFTTTFPDLQG
ncbi:MAG: hypothetical protein NBV63_00865 [Candidatus Pacebacteria bacterium]|jgi:heme A synthase|nr:hypothetical protein [Candidatus Paceibacterota bacterium]